MAKYGMSHVRAGPGGRVRAARHRRQRLWPRTVIATAALQMIPGVDPARCRKPEIMADAAHAVLTRDAHDDTGNFYIDDEVLAADGVTDLEQYSVTPGTKDFVPGLLRRLRRLIGLVGAAAAPAGEPNGPANVHVCHGSGN